MKDIAERGEATKSLMPEGLTDTLTKQEFADLVRFLSELGKVGGPYAPSKARVVRRWQVIEPTNANLNLFRRTRVSAAAEPDNPFAWSPAYSLVSGDLPLAELPKFTVWNDTAAQTVLRFQLDVTTAGAAKLKFNSVAGLSLYLGATPVEAKAETVLDLKAGVQTVTLVIDRSKRTDDVRVELDDVAGSPARVDVCVRREVTMPLSLFAVHLSTGRSPTAWLASRGFGRPRRSCSSLAMWRRARGGRAADRRADRRVLRRVEHPHQARGAADQRSPHPERAGRRRPRPARAARRDRRPARCSTSSSRTAG